MLVALQFQEIAVAEQIPVLDNPVLGFLHPAVTYQAGDLCRGAAGEAHQALVVLFQQFPVNTGTVVKAFQVAAGNQLHQVAVTDVVPGQQHQVIGAAFRSVPVMPAAVRHVNFAADDGLDAGLFAL